MSDPEGTPAWRMCGDLIGLSEAALRERFGEPTGRHVAGGETWLAFTGAELSLRARCAGGGRSRVASWTVTFAEGHSTLEEATRLLGLWPAAAPDEDAATVAAPLIRRPLADPRSGRLLSLTASRRDGRITQVSVFDEAPDWL